MAIRVSRLITDLTEKLELYLVFFPIRLPRRGECAADDIDIGFTNSSVAGEELIKALARDPDLPRWEVVDLSSLSKIAKERILNHYNIKKEDLFEPHGWESIMDSFWITPELLSMLELAKLIKIRYEWNSSADCFAKIGCTNKHVIADKVKSIWKGKIHVELILVKNQEELKRLREEDGGAKYLSQQLEYEGEAEGWITDGIRLAGLAHAKEQDNREYQELFSRLNPPMFLLQ